MWELVHSILYKINLNKPFNCKNPPLIALNITIYIYKGLYSEHVRTSVLQWLDLNSTGNIIHYVK